MPWLSRARSLALRVDPALYTAWAAACTLASALAFYRYMLKQTGGVWSAPLDDVFIHFDYARSTARGYPFQWLEGNGYSSGNTSLLYPFVLAAGYAAGFRDLRLMVWAAIVAAVSVFAVLLAARRLFLVDERHGRERDGAARACSYLLPPMVLGVGALDWSLWSGMEVSLFLATWALALVVFLRVDRARPGTRARSRSAWALGACGALMIVTRPEAVTTIAVFGLACALPRLRRGSPWGAVAELARIALPGVIVMAAQALANHWLTGEWSANGAIVKLAINNPYLTAAEKIDDYVFNLRYGVLRNVEYHFTDVAAFGVIVPALAAAAAASPRTRRAALLLGAQVVGWMLLVAFNGQVRWQNERYTMPAVAWLLVVAALGVHALLRRDARARPTFLLGTLLGALVFQLYGVVTRPAGTEPDPRFAWSLALAIGAGVALVLRWWPARVVAVAAALVLARDHQASKMRDQKWFFGRASRNIYDQHVTTGRFLKNLAVDLRDGRTWRPRRVLVGDAGAIPYAADLPALDIIGLGGFHKYPFARAGVHGLASTIELLEYMPPADRPDVMAIYPSWWGVLPTWFSNRPVSAEDERRAREDQIFPDKILKRVPVEGNVICGGYEDVVYLADWQLLGTGNAPRESPQGESVRDETDVADVISERAHDYVFPHPNGGWTELKVLADPADTTREMLDGGRRLGPGTTERFTLAKLAPQKSAHLVIRSAPEARAVVHAMIDGVEVGSFAFQPTDGWVERVVTIPGERVNETIEVKLFNEGPGDFLDYHVWVTQ